MSQGKMSYCMSDYVTAMIPLSLRFGIMIPTRQPKQISSGKSSTRSQSMASGDTIFRRLMTPSITISIVMYLSFQVLTMMMNSGDNGIEMDESILSSTNTEC